MTDTLYDFAVVGAGPAGATLARLLAAKYKVILIDKKKAGEQKCCGGLLAPDAQKTMANMGLGLPADVLDGPQLFGVRVIDLDQGSSRYYQRFYLNMNRRRFDDYLCSLLPKGVAYRKGSRCIDAQRLENGHWRLDCLGEGGRSGVEARYLIGADGAAGKVRSLIDTKRSCRDYVAFQRFYEEKHEDGVYVALFDSRLSDFYHWVIPKEGYSIVGITAPLKGNARAGMDSLVRNLQQWGLSFSRCIHEEGTRLRRPQWNRGLLLGGERSFLLGEAAGFISPSSAEGISYALRSALILAEVLLEEREERWLPSYSRAARQLRWNIRRKTCKLPVMYNPHLRRMAMGSGLLTLDR